MAHVIRAMPFQREFILAEERFLTFMAGRRAGKTDAIKNRIKWRTRKAGLSYTYIAPLYAQALEVYQELIGDSTYRHVISRYRERPYPHYWLCNGARVKFKSFQRADGLRGTGEDEICIDESQDQKVCEKDVKAVLLPMLGDRRGTLVLAGQFRGHDWRYREFWVPGQAQINGAPNPAKHPLYRSWQIGSEQGFCFQGANGREELELQRSITPASAWAQEWACIPTANQSAVWTPEHIDRITGGEVSSTPRPGCRYIMGLDLGRVVDQSAIVVLEVETGVVVHAEKLPQRQEHAIQAKRAAQVAGIYRACVVMDSTGGAAGGHAPADTHVKFYRQSIPDLREFYWGPANKEKIIAQLSLDIEQCRIRIPSEHAELLRELRSYEYEYRGGRYYYSAPRNQHDDYVAALAMASWGRKSGWHGGQARIEMTARF